MQEILRGYQTKLWCHQKFSATIITSVLWGGVTLFWSMRYLPSADGPLNVFFKLPVTEISQVDDHKSVSLPSFKISFKISQVDSHKSVSLPFLEVSRRMSEQRRYFFFISWIFVGIQNKVMGQPLNRSTAFWKYWDKPFPPSNYCVLYFEVEYTFWKNIENIKRNNISQQLTVRLSYKLRWPEHRWSVKKQN